MLLKTILGYAPSNVVPAIMAVATISVFTRLLPPEAFGRYALTQAVILFGQAAAFYGLQVSVTRFHERSSATRQLGPLLGSAYACYAACALAATLGFVGFVLVLRPAPALAAVLWLALPTMLLRGLVYVNLASHRGAGRIARYNLVEVGQSVLAFVVALVLVVGFGFGAGGLVWGLLAGAAAVLAIDLPLMRRFVNRPERGLLKDLWRFGAPLCVAHLLSAVVLYCDRLFIERLLGAAAVGLYAAAFAVVDRAVSLVFMAVTLGAYPLAIKALEREGRDAARRQHARNGVALLALALPAAAGLAAAAPQVAHVLVGEAYREGVVALIPWVAGLALLRGFSAHFFDQALHLGRRTDLFFYALGPAAVVAALLNLLLLPVLGLSGAILAAFVAQLVAVAVTIALSRRIFPVLFPWEQAFRIVGATAAMAGTLLALPFPVSPVGLGLVVAGGVLVYAAVALLLDVAGARMWLRAAIASRFTGKAIAEHPSAAVTPGRAGT
ncbi:MAG: oligosaccharide flippase family protein [Geminicoccaceae bacterium]|nr:oligosaccharide flippase family protein [Geminicoccaceae bacterium]